MSYSNISKDNSLRLYSWGFGKYGQIGSLDYHYSKYPVEIDYSNIGYTFNNIVKNKEYTDYSTPINNKHDLANNFFKNNNNIQIYNINCGEFHSSLIDTKGNLYMFGKNTFGQLGTGNNDIYSFPQIVNFSFNIRIKYVSLGGEHTLALSDKNQLYSWGLNLYGQLGLNNFNNVNFPTRISVLKEIILNNNLNITKEEAMVNNIDDDNILEISAGSHHSLILTKSKINSFNLYACGYNKSGALGLYNNTNKDNNFMDNVNVFTKLDLSFIKNHIYYEQENDVKNNNVLKEVETNNTDNNLNIKKISNICCGCNQSGFVYDNKYIFIFGVSPNSKIFNFSEPTLIDNSSNYNNYTEIIKFIIGQSFLVFLTTEGDIYTFGENNYGELGNKSQQTNKTPSKVSLVKKQSSLRIVNISVGFNHVIALDSNKNLYGWGSNKYGQLGEEEQERNLNPKILSRLTNLNPCSIFSGAYHNFVITENKYNLQINKLNLVYQNKSLDIDIIDNQVNEISNILNYHLSIESEIKDQEKEIERLNIVLNKLREEALSIKEIHKESKKSKDFNLTNNKKHNKNSLIHKENELFNDNIKIEELTFIDGESNVGTGTFGEVKKCLWRKTLTAVKFLKESNDPKTQADNVKSFIEELNILKKLRHPNILLYLGASIINPYFLVTEYCQHGNLFKFLHEKHKRESISDDKRIRWALGIAKGVNYLHSFNPPILHRDLKSLNILLDQNYHIKIADFGWARLREEHMTKKRGTYQWMAPEVIDKGSYNEKADVYSFGIVLWELYVQKYPYENIHKNDVAKNVVNNPDFRPPITDIIPSNVAELIKKCWDHDESKRPSYEIIIDSLETILKDLLKKN